MNIRLKLPLQPSNMLIKRTLSLRSGRLGRFATICVIARDGRLPPISTCCSICPVYCLLLLWSDNRDIQVSCLQHCLRLLPFDSEFPAVDPHRMAVPHLFTRLLELCNLFREVLERVSSVFQYHVRGRDLFPVVQRSEQAGYVVRCLACLPLTCCVGRGDEQGCAHKFGLVSFDGDFRAGRR